MKHMTMLPEPSRKPFAVVTYCTVLHACVVNFYDAFDRLMFGMEYDPVVNAELMVYDIKVWSEREVIPPPERI